MRAAPGERSGFAVNHRRVERRHRRIHNNNRNRNRKRGAARARVVPPTTTTQHTRTRRRRRSSSRSSPRCSARPRRSAARARSNPPRPAPPRPAPPRPEEASRPHPRGGGGGIRRCVKKGWLFALLSNSWARGRRARWSVVVPRDTPPRSGRDAPSCGTPLRALVCSRTTKKKKKDH